MSTGALAESVHDELTGEQIPAVRVHGKLGSVGRGSCVGVLRTERRPVGTRWVDVNAGDAHSPEIRCWFVAQGVNTFKEDAFFAAKGTLKKSLERHSR